MTRALSTIKENSPVAKLPPQLRNSIFGLLLLAPKAVSIDMSSKPEGLPQLPASDNIQARDALALMVTCKQIRNESAATFYDANEFIIDIRELGDDTSVTGIKHTVRSKA